MSLRRLLRLCFEMQPKRSVTRSRCLFRDFARALRFAQISASYRQFRWFELDLLCGWRHSLRYGMDTTSADYRA